MTLPRPANACREQNTNFGKKIESSPSSESSKEHFRSRSRTLATISDGIPLLTESVMNATSARLYPRLLGALQRTWGARELHGTAARMGVMDNMKKVYDKAVQGSEKRHEEKLFAVQMKFMKDERRMDGNLFLEFLGEVKQASGLGGFKEHLPWVSNNPALGELKEQERVLRAFSGEERKNVYGIGLGALKRVAREAGVERMTVEAMVAQIKAWMTMQRWVKKRVEKGEQLPGGMTEMQSMLMAQGTLNRGRGRGVKMNPGIKGGTSARRKLN